MHGKWRDLPFTVRTLAPGIDVLWFEGGGLGGVNVGATSRGRAGTTGGLSG